MNEKPECGGCIYSEYDYDGRNYIFLGCFKHGECKGAKTPRKQVLEFDVDGVEYTVVQEEWLSCEGVETNLCIFQKANGEWHEMLHSGYFGRFLTEEDARAKIIWLKKFMKTTENDENFAGSKSCRVRRKIAADEAESDGDDERENYKK